MNSLIYFQLDYINYVVNYFRNIICPDLHFCNTYPDVFSALDAAFTTTDNQVVLCGSLYLIGYFLTGLVMDI